MAAGGGPLLEIADLGIRFGAGPAAFPAVSGVSLQLRPREVLGIVGESGSGKSQLLLSIIGLLPRVARASGSIRFGGEELLNRPPEALDRIRGDRISMIFQDPMTSLTPHMRVGRQLAEVLVRHRGMSGRDAAREATQMLDRVRIARATERMQAYPHELSGGMRQRVMIAMALLCRPEILLADEPTTALDVTVQAQILDLLREIVRELGTAIILVTHDFGVVASLADRVVVLYGGSIMEEGEKDRVVCAPRHPYTRGLLGAMPTLEQPRGERISTIPGQPRSGADQPGCSFVPRCPIGMDFCRHARPPLLALPEGGAAACHALTGLVTGREARA